MAVETDIEHSGGAGAAPDVEESPAATEPRDKRPDQSAEDGHGKGRRGRRRAARERHAAASGASKSAPRRRRAWRSPLTRRILAINVAVLVIPVLGLLHLDQYRQSLVGSAFEALRTQGRVFSSSLASTAAITSEEGIERLLPDITRPLMRVLFSDTGIRARIFTPGGELIADSFMLGGPSEQVQVEELPAPDDVSALSAVGRLYDYLTNWIPGLGDLPVYDEAVHKSARDFEEVEATLTGGSPGVARVDRRGRLVLFVAVPVQRYRQILGALLLTKDGSDITAAVHDRRRDILVVFGIALAVTVLLSFYLAGTLGRPIRRLAHAAELVRYGKGRQYEIPDFSKRKDEIGDLSIALREMTEAMWNRLDAIEGFAADVAHEIKNPLTSLRSAVETVARVEDPSQQKRLMSIILDDVARLDRLISDISDASRLDAELSRAESDVVDVGKLLRTLTEVHQATGADEGPSIAFDIAERDRLVVSGLEDRLGQVIRNLLANAISFSPSGGRIVLAARRERRSVIITISDDGPGLPPDKLDNVFDRFYSERPEGEKFGTHSGLGLSISRQIIEAHGGTIRAENRMDDKGAVRGARFVIRLPVD